jgi:hypothetical protein
MEVRWWWMVFTWGGMDVPSGWMEMPELSTQCTLGVVVFTLGVVGFWEGKVRWGYRFLTCEKKLKIF